MTNETIYKQIKKLNSGNHYDSIFLRPLSLFVDFSSTWIGISDSEYYIYYIKNEMEYVGAVVDMGQRDLHWFVAPEHRKKGYLTSAMKKTILPHLFQDREEQKVTFDSTDTEEDSFASEKAATLMGFYKEAEEYVIRKSDIDMNIEFLPLKPKLSKERYNYLNEKLKTIKNEVAKISAEFYMIADIDLEADNLKSKVNSVILNLEDAYFDINGDEDDE